MASMNSAIQFYGIPAVMQAYTSKQVAPWALFCGSRLIDSCNEADFSQAEDLLRQQLKMLVSNNSAATYTLQIYNNLPKLVGKGVKGLAEITSKTPYSGSFNFKLFNMGENPYSEYKNQAMDALNARIQQLEEIIIKQNEDKADNEPEPLSGIGAVLQNIWEVPEIKAAVVGKIVNFMHTIMGDKQMTTPAALGKVAGLPDLETEQAQFQKINAAVQVLYQADPLLGDHLTDLANLAVKNPGQFRNLLSMLNTFK